MMPIASKVTARNNGIQVLSHQNLQKAIRLSRFVLFVSSYDARASRWNSTLALPVGSVMVVSVRK